MVKIIGGPKIYIPNRPGEPEITHADIKIGKKFSIMEAKNKFRKWFKEGIKKY